jgi:gliding motility-associated-like protein
MPVAFNTIATNTGSTPAYQWAVNGQPVGGNTNSLTSNTLSAGNNSVTCTITPSLACAVPVTSVAVYVTVNPLPQIRFNPDTVYISSNGALLAPIVTGTITQYQWAPGIGLSTTSADTALANPPNSTTYLLTVTSAQGCVNTAKITALQNLPLLMPGAFTPNGDGYNDVFRIPPGVWLLLDGFDVFNRWGSKVFSTKNISQGWDGTFKGLPVPPGTYVYVIKGKTPSGGPVLLKGTVVLVR